MAQAARHSARSWTTPMRTRPGLGCRGIQPSRRPFAEHCYLNNTSTDQFARARSAFPFCYDRSGRRRRQGGNRRELDFRRSVPAEDAAENLHVVRCHAPRRNVARSGPGWRSGLAPNSLGIACTASSMLETMRPVSLSQRSPGPIYSGKASTGVPHAMASIMTSPKGSGQSIGKSNPAARPRNSSWRSH